MTVWHVSQHVDRPAAEVVDYVRTYAKLPEWAAGLADGIREQDGHWLADSPMGAVEVRFVPANDYGVCDHDVTLPDGSVTTNPVRVIADGADACDIVFTLRRGEDDDEDQFEADVATVTSDLERLRGILENS